jgi:hypothetical protein
MHGLPHELQACYARFAWLQRVSGPSITKIVSTLRAAHDVYAQSLGAAAEEGAAAVAAAGAPGVGVAKAQEAEPEGMAVDVHHHAETGAQLQALAVAVREEGGAEATAGMPPAARVKTMECADEGPRLLDRLVQQVMVSEEEEDLTWITSQLPAKLCQTVC